MAWPYHPTYGFSKGKRSFLMCLTASRVLHGDSMHGQILSSPVSWRYMLTRTKSMSVVFESHLFQREGWFTKVEAISKQETDNPEARRGGGDDDLSRCHGALTLHGFHASGRLWRSPSCLGTTKASHSFVSYGLSDPGQQSLSWEEWILTHLPGQSQLTKPNQGLPRYGTRSAHLNPDVSP